MFFIFYINQEEENDISVVKWISIACGINIFATAVGESTLIGYIKCIP